MTHETVIEPADRKASVPGMVHPRLAELERGLGEAWDDSNPVGFPSVLRADERAEVLTAGEDVLDAFGLNAEFVPPEFGGHLTRTDQLIQLMRAVCRRDPSLIFGYGIPSLMAAVNVWAAGSASQCRDMAGRLLANQKFACAYHELAHGGDLAQVDLDATDYGHGRLFNGGKQVIANVERADGLVLFARTDRQAGSRSHSQFLLDKAALPPDRFQYLPRYHTGGLRGVQLGGMEFVNCPVPSEAMVGPVGHGMETALRSFQLTRVVLPGVTVGVLDTALRAAVRYALGRKLYGRAVTDLPHPRAVLVDTFVDLLLSDCVSTVAARALHTLPREAGVTAAAAKYLVPTVLVDAVTRLSTLLGAQFYLRGGDHMIMQKLVRDITPTSVIHASRTTCQLSILPQLPLLARRSWSAGEPAPEQTFQLFAGLPNLRFAQLTLSSGGNDHLCASLRNALELTPGDGEHREIRSLLELFAAELDDLTGECAPLRPAELTVTASRQLHRLTARYAVVLAASCCVNIWRHASPDQPFLRHPGWVSATLIRLAARLGRRPGGLPEHIRAHLFDELLHRYHDSRTFDLACSHLGSVRRDDEALPGGGR